ncbi:hypothetical protein, partial [Providencia stuartii]|uniref:hypothetical protein n=1 Tax=Providencia stuartii TaxID=588 RepID=UPI001952BAD9
AQHDTVLAQPALAYGGVQERHPDQASHGFPRLIDDPSPAIVPCARQGFRQPVRRLCHRLRPRQSIRSWASLLG